ncbi:MAG: hypothetical protein FWH41_02085 [Treponema sp.]|nr:hypothetical protein [Treponema sp.]
MFLFVNGFIFGKNEGNEENAKPKNTITIDAGPTMFSLFVWSISEHVFFGTAVQYERHLAEKTSLAARLSYRVVSLSNYYSNEVMSSFSVEGHGRIYPGKGVFFLNGMLGYANFIYSYEKTNSFFHFFQFGTKLGWKIDFGKPGGIVLEPSLGYYGAIGKPLFRNSDIDVIEALAIKWYFVGGPRLSLGLGYSF